MIKKRAILFGVLLSLSVILITNFVSAQYYGYGSGFIDLGIGMQQIIDQIIRFFDPLLRVVLSDYSSSEFFFAKVMFLILLIIIIYFILDHVPLFQGYRTIAMMVSLIVSIIAVRFISENEFITFILLPYGTLGIAITSAIPFFIFAYGIHTTGLPGIGRKIAWGFFGIVFFALWIYKFNEINTIGNQIYLWTLVAIGIMMVFDRSIHAYFRGLNIKDFERRADEERIAELKAQYLRYRDLDDPESLRVKRRIARKLRWYGSRPPD